MSTSPAEAAEALAAMRRSRAELAAAADCPPERHMAFAALLGGVVAAQAASGYWVMVIEAVLAVGVGLVVAWDRQRTGMFINGYRAGRTRPLTFTLLGITFALGALGVWLKWERGIARAPVACGVVVAFGAYFASAWWQAIYRRELQETP
jgi:hypothetical protein